MKKMALIIASAMLLLTSISYIVAGPVSLVYTLDQTEYDVKTDNGNLDLPEGTEVGGNPTNYVTITEARTMLTKEEGNVNFPSGTVINCDHAPGEPDPC